MNEDIEEPEETPYDRLMVLLEECEFTYRFLFDEARKKESMTEQEIKTFLLEKVYSALISGNPKP